MKEIFMLYYEINNIYLELYKLELDGCLDSDFFLKLINLLKEKLIEEKNIYENLCCKLDLFKFDKNRLIFFPSAKRFANYMNFYNDMNISNSMNDDISIKFLKLHNVCTKNIYLIYLSFFQECIDLNNIELERECLLRYKYSNSFTNHDIERQLVLNKFNVNKIKFVNLFMVSKIIGIDESVANKIIYDYFYDVIIATIINLLCITDFDYENDVNRKVFSINNQCMLRAVLSFYDEDEFKNMEDRIYNIVGFLCDDSNKIGVDIIHSILNNRCKDVVRVKKLSLISVDI